jgi:hypothetical protein
VIAGAAQKQHLAFTSSAIVRVIKNIAVSIFGNIPAVHRMLQVELSETDIVYRGGPLVALGAPPRRARRSEVGSRARDAAFTDPATGQTTTLWPPLSKWRHSLLLFEDTRRATDTNGIAAGTGDRMQILRLDPQSDPERKARERYRLRGPGWALIRPDQVVAARGEGTDWTVLNTYLDRVVRSGTTLG